MPPHERRDLLGEPTLDIFASQAYRAPYKDREDSNACALKPAASQSNCERDTKAEFMMKRSGIAAAMVAAATAAALLQSASAQISPGTTLIGSIDRSLNSKSVQVGQAFLLTDVHTTNYDINHATLYGHVSHVQRAGQGTTAKIELDVDKINTRAGNIYKITGHVTNVQVNTKSNAGKEIGAAAGGALVGGLLGKGAGAVIGAAGGYLIAKNSKENIEIPQGSAVTVEVSQSYRVTR
jgi:hypothetical protein